MAAGVSLGTFAFERCMTWLGWHWQEGLFGPMSHHRPVWCALFLAGVVAPPVAACMWIGRAVTASRSRRAASTGSAERRLAPATCPQCGYALHAGDRSAIARCPECGLDDPPASVAALIDEHARSCGSLAIACVMQVGTLGALAMTFPDIAPFRPESVVAWAQLALISASALPATAAILAFRAAMRRMPRLVAARAGWALMGAVATALAVVSMMNVSYLAEGPFPRTRAWQTWLTTPGGFSIARWGWIANLIIVVLLATYATSPPRARHARRDGPAERRLSRVATGALLWILVAWVGVAILEVVALGPVVTVGHDVAQAIATAVHLDRWSWLMHRARIPLTSLVALACAATALGALRSQQAGDSKRP